MKNWYIGQRIVAIRNHPNGLFKTGDEFTIKALKSAFCKCDYIAVDIGIRVSGKCFCSKCQIWDKETTDEWWIYSFYFSPLDEIESAISELMTEVNRVIK